MVKALAGVILLASATSGWAASRPTDFGLRVVPGEAAGVVLVEPAGRVATRALGIGYSVDLRAVAGLGSQWGRVTSTIRSVAHNRAVGGVRNSYHLRGRAIDIARRPGVTHAQIAAAFRNAGYYLIESLDEGDHSHFAFGSASQLTQRTPGLRRAGMEQASARQASSSASTQWRIVTASSAAFK
jgi:hypothetical protein